VNIRGRRLGFSLCFFFYAAARQLSPFFLAWWLHDRVVLLAPYPFTAGGELPRNLSPSSDAKSVQVNPLKLLPPFRWAR